MRIEKKKTSPRGGSLKGKYLFAKPRGGAEYRPGPPPVTSRKMPEYLKRHMLRMAPYPGMMKRYDAYVGTETSGAPLPGSAPPPPQEEPEEIIELGENTKINLYNAVNTVRTGMSTVARMGRDMLSTRWSDYANAVLPTVNFLIANDDLPVEIALQLVLGDYAEPIISVIRTSSDSARWIRRAFRDVAVRPVVQYGRNQAIQYISREAATYFDRDLVNTFVVDGPGPSRRPILPGELPPGAAGPQLPSDILFPTSTENVPTSTMNFGEGYSGPGVAGGISITSALINYLIASAPNQVAAPPPEILRLAGTVSGPAYFSGGRTLRLTPARRARTDQIVNNAIRNNAFGERVTGYFRRRMGRPG